MLDDQLKKIIYLIDVSDLDQTIKEILVRDLISQGLTDFMREQIRAYCLDGLSKIDAQTEAARQILTDSAVTAAGSVSSGW